MSIIAIKGESREGTSPLPSDHPEGTPRNSSLLESLLLCMSEDRRADLLTTFANGVVYVNRVPSCAFSIPLKLTQKAQGQLQAVFSEAPVTTEGCGGGSAGAFAYLKVDLEAGIRLDCRRPDTMSNDALEKGVSLTIKSHRFTVSCRLYPHANSHNASLIATNIECSRAQKAGGFSRPLFSPCTWDILPYDLATPLYFDTATFQRIAAEISSRLHPLAHGAGTGDHLLALGLLVGVNRLAMSHPYEVLSREEDRITLRIQGPREIITEMERVCVYMDSGVRTASVSDPEKSMRGDSIARWRRLPIVLNQMTVEETDDGENAYSCASPVDGDVPSSGLIVDLGVASQLDKETRAITSLQDACRNKSPDMIRLANLLGSVHFARLGASSRNECAVQFVDSKLTQRQQQAVAKALSTPDICLIHGPPGTGKTRVICEIVQQAIAKKWTILLVAPTHVAVDNVLERIGEMNDVNAVRCATKRKVPNLSDFIRQFTYEQRLGALTQRCIQKIDQHLKHLHHRRIQIANAVRILGELLSLRADLTVVQDRRDALRETISLLPREVRGEFADALDKVRAIQDAATLTYARAEKHLKATRSALQKARKRAQCVRQGSYSSEDASRFVAVEKEVKKLHGKAIFQTGSRRDSLKEKVATTENAIRQVKSRLSEASQILGELDAGGVPSQVEAAIRESISPLSAKHSRAISAKNRTLAEAKKQRVAQQEIRDALAGRLAAVRAKLGRLPAVRKTPWWRRPGQLVWWETLLVDHAKREKEYSALYENQEGVLAACERKVESAKSALLDAQEAKTHELATATSSELDRLHESYRSQCQSLPLELDALAQELERHRREYQTAQDAAALVLKAYEEALQVARESTRREIRRDAAGELKEARRRSRVALEDYHRASRDMNAANENAAMLDGQINDITAQRSAALDLQLRQLTSIILRYQGMIDHKEKTAEQFLGHPVPPTPQEVEAAIKQLPSAEPAIDAEQRFLADWRGYVERESERLERRLAGYINLICATTVGIASDDYFGDGAPLEQREFDLVILDEAGKVTEPEFLVAATRAKRWVPSGDCRVVFGAATGAEWAWRRGGRRCLAPGCSLRHMGFRLHVCAAEGGGGPEHPDSGFRIGSGQQRRAVQSRKNTGKWML